VADDDEEGRVDRSQLLILRLMLALQCISHSAQVFAHHVIYLNHHITPVFLQLLRSAWLQIRQTLTAN